MAPSSRPTCMPLAQTFCLGRGLEIGAAAYSDFGVDAFNLDLTPYPLPSYFEAQMHHAGWVAPIHLVGLAERLPVASDSQDFLLASHVIEHSPNPISTLLEWNRVIRPGGVLFLIVPHKERTPDRVRPRTTLAHVIDDYQTEQTHQTHHETDGFLTAASLHTPHYHAWITVDFLEIVAWMIEQDLADWFLEAIEDVDSDRQSGFTLVLRKQARPARRERVGAWVSRGALRSMLRCPEQIALLRAQGVVGDADLLEVTAGSLLSQDILIQDLERHAKRLEQQVAQQTEELTSLRSWASEMQTRLRTLQGKALHVPALAWVRGELEGAAWRLWPPHRSAAPAAQRAAHQGEAAEAPAPPLRDEAFFDRLVGARAPQNFQRAQRWGSGEVEITQLELLDEQGQLTTTVWNGRPMTVRLHYVAHEPVPAAVFGLAISSHSGVQVCGMNTAGLGTNSSLPVGPGTIACVLERLELLAGDYLLSAAIYEPQLQHAYDHQHDGWSFTISGERRVAEEGVVRLLHWWEFPAASQEVVSRK